MSELLESLNPVQREAVEATEGPVLILAGAGSGKTRVLTHRIAYLISERGVAPWNILAITFTNKAAGEMKERVERLCDEDGGKVWVATFHSTCVRILRQHAELLGYSSGFTIYDSDDQKTLMKRVVKGLDLDPKMYAEKMLCGKVSAWKNACKEPDDAYKESGDFRERKIAEIYDEYQKQLRANDAMDFDDLLVNTVKLFKEHSDVLASWQQRFRYIMVDEYQDTNTVQFYFISLLAAAHRNICVVGDDDQSIYGFRGADIRNILDFEKVFTGVKVIKLEQNYRSTGNILNTANEVISHNFSRKEKRLWTDHDAGDVVDLREYDTGYDEAEGIITDIMENRTRFAYGECAVLYRTNAQSRLFEEKCVLYGVPYKLVGGVNFYQRREIKDVVAYLKTLDGARDDLAVQRIINVPKRGIGQTTVSRIADFARENELSFFEGVCCAAAGEINGISGGAVSKLTGFLGLIDQLSGIRAQAGLKELVEAVVDKSGYRKELQDEKTVEAETRLENIEELINKAAEYPDTPGDQEALTQFLEEIALIADVDTLDDEENRVVLMTLHGAKGLEFSRVYMAGMEEGLFPSGISMSSGKEDDIEEERRLCYVGITRAKEKLTLTFAHSRMVNGETRFERESRFIGEIPDKLLQRRNETRGGSSPGGGYGMNTRGRGSSYKFGGYGSSSYGNPLDDYYSYDYGVKSEPRASYARPGENFSKEKDAIAAGVARAYMGSTLMNGSADAPDYGEGDRVSHVKFGEGTVVLLEKGKRDYEVTVDFDRVGTKKLFASFAKLKKL